MEGDNKLIHEQKCGDQTLKILRDFSGDEMKMILEAPPPAGATEPIVSTRIYKKL